jgi:UDP-N-acetylmuramoyl-L-alanyl-D-glutamate--2,6-diaminopimelate ligase
MKNIGNFPQIYPVACHTDNVGPETTFVVIKGMKDDGLRYVPQALAKGATKIVIERDLSVPEALESFIYEAGASILRVENARKALAELSAEALGHPASRVKIIGITGTKGKSTTTFLLEHMLSTAGLKTALISTVANRICGVDFEAPLTTPQPDYLHVFFNECVKAGVEIVVMETAAQAFSCHRVDGIMFDGAIFTNFSPEHGEFYATYDDYFEAKKMILKHLKPGAPLVLNADDEKVASLAALWPNPRMFTVANKKSAHWATSAQLLDSSVAGLTCAIEHFSQTYSVHAPMLMGTFNCANIAAAATIAHELGISYITIAQAVNSFKGVPGRLNKYDLPNKVTAFIDQAHTPSSFQAALETLRPLTDQLIVVFGCGGDRDTVKRPHMGRIAASIADAVILSTDNPRSEDPVAITQAIYKGVEQKDLSKVMIELDREKAIHKAYSMARPSAIIALLGKGVETYQIVGNQKIHFSEVEIVRNLQA